jgi:hypothetical protein
LPVPREWASIAAASRPSLAIGVYIDPARVIGHTHADEGHKDLAGYVARESPSGHGTRCRDASPDCRPAHARYLSECPRADAKNAATMLAAEQSY